MDTQSKKVLTLTKIYSIIVMMARFAITNADLMLIQVYVLTTKHSDAEMEETYELIEKSLKATKAQDIVLIMGDWNAIIGEGKDDNIAVQYGLGM